MANKRRMANRRESQRHHSESGFSGSKGTVSRSSGSHAHIGERMGPGEVPGAGQLPARGPGSSMETKGRMDMDAYPSRSTPGAPSGVRNRTRGREEDGE